MKNYKNKEYLEGLLNTPEELKKQILVSYGEVLHEMFEQGVIPPLNLLSTKKNQTAIGTAVVQLYSNHYDSGDFMAFLATVVSNEKNSRRRVKYGSHFLKSVKPQIEKYLPKEDTLEKDINISSVKEYLSYLSEITIEEPSSQRKKIIKDKLEKLTLDNFLSFKDLHDVEILELLEKNVPLLDSIFSESVYNYEALSVSELIFAAVEVHGKNEIPDTIMPHIPLSLMFTKFEKSEDNIQFMREVIDFKMLKNNKLLTLGLSRDHYHYFDMFHLDYKNEKDKNIIWEVIKFENEKIYSHEAFRGFILRSKLAKLVPIEELTSKFYNANKLGVEIKNIWSDESIDSIVQMASLTRSKTFDIDSLTKFFQDGRPYTDKFLENIQIPEDFLQRLDKKLEENDCHFVHRQSAYYRDSTIYGDKLSAYTQVLSYFVKKQINSIQILKDPTEDDVEMYKDVLEFLFGNFSALTDRDGYFSRNNEDEEGVRKMISVIKLENLIYDFSKEFFQISQKYFKYSDIDDFKEMYNRNTDELSYGLVSALVQNIKKPSLLWALDDMHENNNSRSYSGFNINRFKASGLAYEESLKSYLAIPMLDKESACKEIESLTDYHGSRSRIVGKLGYETGYIYIGLIHQIINKERFTEMSDVDYYQHLNAVKDYLDKKQLSFGAYYSKFTEQITEQQKKLNIGELDRDSLPSDYIHNMNYFNQNFSMGLLFKNLVENENFFAEWDKEKHTEISKDVIDSIIREVFEKFHNTRYSNRKEPKEILIKGSENFIFNFVKENPESFDDIKEKLLTGPHAQLYQSLFVKNDRDIVKEMISTHSTENLEVLYDLVVLDDLAKNMGKIIQSKNQELLTVLKNKLPGDNFIKMINQCSYQDQRLLLNNEAVTSGMREYSSSLQVLFNPQTFEEFQEVFESLRLKKRMELFPGIESSSDNEMNYYDMKQKWESASVLTFMNIPNLDSVVNYLIDEVPLSFLSSYELSVDGSYKGKFPRSLEPEEFLRLLNKINKESPGTMYLGHDTNAKNELYDSLIAVSTRKEKDMSALNKYLDNYLKTLDILKNNPKDYAQMVAQTQNFISDIVSKVLDQKEKVYSWKELPEDCVLLKEIQNVFQSKYQWPEVLSNNASNSHIYREEYTHKFFNIFIDKKVYLEGIKQNKEDFLLTEGMSKKIYENFYRSCLYPFFYEVKLSTYKTCYSTDYTKEELDKISKDLLDVNSSLLFDYNFPKMKFLRNIECDKIAKREGKDDLSSLNDEEYREGNQIALVNLIDEDINNENLWSIMLSTEYNNHSNLEEDRKEKIFEDILGKPDLDLEMINKLSKLLKLHEYLKESNPLADMDNRMLGKLSQGMFSYMNDNDIKKTEVILEQLYMEKTIEKNSSQVGLKPKKF